MADTPAADSPRPLPRTPLPRAGSARPEPKRSRFIPPLTTHRRPGPKLPPLRWATTPNSVVAWAWYVDGVRQECTDLNLATERAKVGDGFVWLGLADPTDKDMESFARRFGLHQLAIEDAVEGHTRSKLEFFDDTLFTVISTVAYVDHESITDSSEIVSTGQIMVFVGPNFVLTVRRGEQRPLADLRATLEAEPDELVQGPSYVLYKIYDAVVDDYLRVVADIEQDVDEIEELVFSRQGTHEVDRVYQLKRELIEFKRSVVPLGPPLMALATRDYAVVPETARPYFREVSDHHLEAREAIASFDEVLSSLLQAGLARASVADNQDMRKISAAVAILAIPTTLGAIYGMNFDNMPELHTRYGYFVVIALMVVGMIVAYLFFRRNRWL